MRTSTQIWNETNEYISFIKRLHFQSNLKASLAIFHMWPCTKNFSTSKYFLHSSLTIYPFPTPPIKLKLGLQRHERLLMTTKLEQSNSSEPIVGVRLCYNFN